MRILFALLTVWFAVFVTITIAHSMHLLYMVYLSEHEMRLDAEHERGYRIHLRKDTPGATPLTLQPVSLSR